MTWILICSWYVASWGKLDQLWDIYTLAPSPHSHTCRRRVATLRQGVVFSLLFSFSFSWLGRVLSCGFVFCCSFAFVLVNVVFLPKDDHGINKKNENLLLCTCFESYDWLWCFRVFCGKKVRGRNAFLDFCSLISTLVNYVLYTLLFMPFPESQAVVLWLLVVAYESLAIKAVVLKVMIAKTNPVLLLQGLRNESVPMSREILTIW